MEREGQGRSWIEHGRNYGDCQLLYMSRLGPVTRHMTSAGRSGDYEVHLYDCAVAWRAYTCDLLPHGVILSELTKLHITQALLNISVSLPITILDVTRYYLILNMTYTVCAYTGRMERLTEAAVHWNFCRLLQLPTSIKKKMDRVGHFVPFYLSYLHYSHTRDCSSMESRECHPHPADFLPYH